MISVFREARPVFIVKFGILELVTGKWGKEREERFDL
jgi:hypothetical protein